MGLFDIFKTENREKAEKKQTPIRVMPEPPKEPPEIKQPSSYVFTDQDRQRAIESREQAQQLKDMREFNRNRLAQLQAELNARSMERQIERLEKKLSYGDEDDEEEEGDEDGEDYNEEGYINLGELGPIVQGLIQGFKNTPQNSGITQAPAIIENPPAIRQAPGVIELSDAEIEDIIAAYPEQAKQAQKMPDAVISKFIVSQIPNVGQDSVKRGIDILKKKDFKVLKNAKK